MKFDGTLRVRVDIWGPRKNAGSSRDSYDLKVTFTPRAVWIVAQAAFTVFSVAKDGDGST